MAHFGTLSGRPVASGRCSCSRAGAATVPRCLPATLPTHGAALHSRRTQRGGHTLVCRASATPPETSTAASAPAAATSTASSQYVEEQSFRIEQISFGAILTPLGVGMLTYGFGAFFNLLPGANISALILIYGFPISILGFALSYAQLKPVPCRSTREALELRDSQMTDIQKQVREDVTRFRYGDEQHLDEALNRVFLIGRQGGLPRRLTPRLKGVREEVTDGSYTLVLEFENKVGMTTEQWEQRQPKMESFFGPGIKATLSPTEQGMDVALICDGSGAGRGGGDRKDVLPPLMPGLPARRQ